MLCFALVNHIENSELYPKSSLGPLGISEQKGKIRLSFFKKISLGAKLAMKGTSVKTRGLVRNPLSNQAREMRTNYTRVGAVEMEKICRRVRSRAARTWY